MSNTQALIAEVKSDLGRYDDANLLDEDSMYRDIIIGLKKFGNDVTILFEHVAEVEDGTADLPDNFRSLYFAYECQPKNYKVVNGKEDILQESIYYRERHERTSTWNECDDCCETQTDKVIRENLYIKGEKIATYEYDRPRLLTLGKSFVKNACHSGCRNKMVRDNPNEIIIIGTTLQANYSEGHIYMQYYGLPVDEDGLIDIPETFNGYLEEYLEYRVKRKATERLLAKKDSSGLQTLFQEYAQQERTLKRSASGSLKMGKMKRGLKRWHKMNRYESMQYDSAILNL